MSIEDELEDGKLLIRASVRLGLNLDQMERPDPYN